MPHLKQPPIFLSHFGSERQCRRFLFRKKWSEGFKCPRCQFPRALERNAGRRWICGRRGCTYWESATRGTIAESIKKPLRLWFWGMWLYTHSRGSLTAARLKKELGFGSYQTAWTWCQKYRKAFELDPDLAGSLLSEAPVDTEAHPARAGLGTHGWRGGQKGLATGLHRDTEPTGAEKGFWSWLLALNGARVSLKHARSYWCEKQVWTQWSTPAKRWQVLCGQVMRPPIPYWRLVGRVAPRVPLSHEANPPRHSQAKQGRTRCNA